MYKIMLEFIEKEAKVNVNKYLIIFLHGWGSDKNDLMSLTNYFDETLKNVHYISVNAPFNCDSGNGYQWFSLNDISPYSIMIGVRDNYKILETFIKEQSTRLNIDYDHIFLLGFSQGAMMSLYTGIRLDKKIAGIIALSGLLPETAETMKANLQTKQKILMLHGSKDRIVPHKYFLQSEKIFKAFDFDIKTSTIYGMTHTINEKVIGKVIRFLNLIINNVDLKK